MSRHSAIHLGISSLAAALVCAVAWQQSMAQVEVPIVSSLLISGAHRLGSLPYNADPLPYEALAPSSPSQLIPTRWETNTGLIPTQIDAEVLPVQALISGKHWTPADSLGISIKPQLRAFAPLTPAIPVLRDKSLRLTSPGHAGARMTNRSGIATVPKLSYRRRLDVQQAPQEAIPQQK